MPDYATGAATVGGLSACSPGGGIPTAPCAAAAMARPRIRPSGPHVLPHFSAVAATARQRGKVRAVAGVMASPWLLLAVLSCGHSGDQGRKSIGAQNLAGLRTSTHPQFFLAKRTREADGRCCLAVGASLGGHAGQPAGVLPYWRGLRLPSFLPAVRLVAAALAVTDGSQVGDFGRHGGDYQTSHFAGVRKFRGARCCRWSP